MEKAKAQHEAIRSKIDKKGKEHKMDKEGRVHKCPKCGYKLGKVENETDEI